MEGYSVGGRKSHFLVRSRSYTRRTNGGGADGVVVVSPPAKVVRSRREGKGERKVEGGGLAPPAAGEGLTRQFRSPFLSELDFYADLESLAPFFMRSNGSGLCINVSSSFPSSLLSAVTSPI